MGILPTAPGCESLAQVHQKMARMWALEAEEVSVGEESAFWRGGLVDSLELFHFVLAVK